MASRLEQQLDCLADVLLACRNSADLGTYMDGAAADLITILPAGTAQTLAPSWTVLQLT